MLDELHPVTSADDWTHLHRIRRTVLFTPGRHSVVYDENHPDDRAEGNIPFLLLRDRHPIGVVRLDFRGETAVVRLVAIAEDEQGNGYGRKLNDLIESEVRRRGVKTLFVNARPEAVGYYEKTVWHQAHWDPDELTGLAKDCIQMTKSL